MPGVESGASLVAFRIGFGLLVAFAGLRYFWTGWYRTHFIEPEFAFAYAGLEWLVTHDPILVIGRLILIIGAGLALASGRAPRLAALTIALGFSWQHLSDKALFLNHYYLVALVALWAAAVPWSTINQSAKGPTAHRFWRLSACALFASVWIGGALAKMNPTWLFEHQPLRIWLLARSDVPGIGPLLALPEAAAIASWAGLLFDLLIPAALLWTKTRRGAVISGLVFHGTTQWLFPVGIFPTLMILGSSLFLAPNWPEFLWRRLPEVRDRAESSVKRPSFAWRTAVLLGLSASALFSLRHPPGTQEILWHEAGFRFSWRVMAMEKRGSLVYEVRLRNGEILERWRPEDFLSPLQASMASTRPDLMVQAGQELARRVRSREGRAISVFAIARTSLNGYPSCLMLDPDLDLDMISAHAWARDWVSPWPLAREPQAETP